MIEADQEIQLPRTLDTAEYVRARVNQIAELLEVVDNAALAPGQVTSGPRTVFQRLPRHMRRRAMSHNIKRLPRSVRPFSLRNVARAQHRKKPPSRLWRRRPSRMLKRLIREKRKKVWLETHIWHAKRFRMQDYWGYKVPSTSFQRAFRPSYRSAATSSVIVDKSYLCCFQIENSSAEKGKAIADILNLFCHKEISATFINKQAVNGGSEMSTLLYLPGRYPHDFLGPARFSWTQKGMLNLWIHPSMEQDFLRTISKLAEKYYINVVNVEKRGIASNTNSSVIGDIERMDGSDTKLFNRKNRFCRFELIGPKCLLYLQRALNLVCDEQLGVHGFFEFKASHDWWRKFSTKAQLGNLTPGKTISLLIEDPRLFRSRAFPDPSLTGENPVTNVPDPPPPPSDLIWDCDYFEKSMLKKRLSCSNFEKLCAGRLAVPRSTDFKIPILLIFRRTLNSGKINPLAVNRVDLVCPSGIGHDIWISLQFAKIRAIGLVDHCSLNFQRGSSVFPDEAIDSRAGKISSAAANSNLMQKYERKPKNRRIDFAKLHLDFDTFDFGWTKILDVAQKEDYYYVLRNKAILQRLHLWLNGRISREEVNYSDIEQHNCCLVLVSLKMEFRSIPKRLAAIYLPTQKDIQEIPKNKKIPFKKENNCSQFSTGMGENGENENPPLTNGIPEYIAMLDDNSNSYIQLGGDLGKLVSLNEMFPNIDRKQMKREKNRLERHRKRKKNSLIKKNDGRTRTIELEPEQQKMEDESQKQVYAERALVGRVTQGDFSFVEARGMALGYITLDSLSAVAMTKRVVLVRNRTSKYYFPAWVNIHMGQDEL